MEKELSSCERMIMGVLTRADEDLTLMRVTSKMKEDFGKEWKLQTVATFMKRLESKGYIDVYKKGRYSYYHPKFTRDEMVKRDLDEIRKIYGVEV